MGWGVTHIAYTVWDSREKNLSADAICDWLASADESGALLVINVDAAQIDALLSHPDLQDGEVYRVSNGLGHVRWRSFKAREASWRREQEHRELLLILQDALIDISQCDPDRASRLAARAYVNLKTDPQGQRRFDELLHRFTGVLHRRPKSDSAPTS